MSLAIKYENVDDAQMRLLNTVVLYDSKPVFVKGITRSMEKGDILRVNAFPLPYNCEEDPYNEIKNKYISSKFFDIAPFRMGYVNLKKGVVYASRLPARQQSQGLSAKTLMLTCPEGAPSPLSWAGFLKAPEVTAMLANDYPSFPRALPLVLKERIGLAFHREFALVPDPMLHQLVYVYHKNVKIGFVAQGCVELGEKAKCLVELLEECGVPIR